MLEDFKNIEINKTMHFNITIHEAVQYLIFRWSKYNHNVSFLNMEQIAICKCNKYKQILKSQLIYSKIHGIMRIQYWGIKIIKYCTIKFS
jgi:hypothetical protein